VSRFVRHSILLCRAKSRPPACICNPQGNILSLYTEKKYSTGVDTISLSEQYLYGASRLGVLRPNLKLAANDKNFVMDSVYSHTLGLKNYELTNHLGNVLAVVSDEKQSAIAAEVLSK